jgi:hypothetical protein
MIAGRRRKAWAAVGLAGLTLIAPARTASAAELQPETVAAWDAYVEVTEQRITHELAAADKFLVQDFLAAPETSRRSLAAGEIDVAKMTSHDGAGRPIPVPGGMIHHWRGSVLLPGVSLDEVLTRVANPSLRDVAPEDVLDVRVLERGADWLRLFLRLQRSQIVTAVYDTEHRVDYTRHTGLRASSRSIATRIVEVADAGTPRERARPLGQDRGFLWRLNAYWRYEQTDTGVVVECESLSLSRSIPSLLAVTIRPIIDRVARGSMERTLATMRLKFSDGKETR